MRTGCQPQVCAITSELCPMFCSANPAQHSLEHTHLLHPQAHTLLCACVCLCMCVCVYMSSLPLL